MGPRSNERGNDYYNRLFHSDQQLQWGHVQMNVEIPYRNLRISKTYNASMGPRSNERGNFDSLDSINDVRMASMGPRSNERGNFKR